MIAGAYKATPTRMVEVETFVPPLDLYLNGRIAAFQKRLEDSGLDKEIRQACGEIRRRLRGKRGRRKAHCPTPGQRRREWVQKWEGDIRSKSA